MSEYITRYAKLRVALNRILNACPDRDLPGGMTKYDLAPDSAADYVVAAIERAEAERDILVNLLPKSLIPHAIRALESMGAPDA